MAEVGTPPVRAERKDRAAGAWTNLVEEADDGGEGTAEPVVNVYTKLKDNKRCVSCALWGRRRFFGDWEWREAKPRCKKCVKDSEKAKDAAKFGKRANFIAMNRTASTTRGGTASDFGESNEANGGARAVRANSAQARASDASRRPRSIAALRERRLSAGSNANGDGFGGRDDDDDDDYDATSPPNRFSPDGARASASLSAFASRGTPRAATKHAYGSANGKKGSSRDSLRLSPDGDWAGAYYSRRGERGYDPAAEARALEASLPTRAQRVLERAAILTGRGDSYRPTSTMSDAGPRGGRTLARRFGALAPDPRKEPLLAAKLFARNEGPVSSARSVEKKQEETGGDVSDDDDGDEVFVSRVPEVRRSTLYPGAGYVPVRERLASGDAGAARYSFSSRGGRIGSAGSGGAFGLSRRVTESAPVTPLYRRGSLGGGDAGVAAFGSLGETDRGEERPRDERHRVGPERSQSQNRSRPSSYVAGLMGKSGLGALDANVSATKSKSTAAGRDASPFAEASSRTPRAASHLSAPTTNGNRMTTSRMTTSLMTSADLDRALFASRETLSAKKALPSALSPNALGSSRFDPKLFPKAISTPSQELKARLSMYAPSRARSAASARTKAAFASPLKGEDARTPGETKARRTHRRTSECDSFDELRPTPPSARPGAEESSAPSTPFDKVPSALEALALRDAERDDEDNRSPNQNSPGSGLWYGSSAKTPNRAFRAVLDACRLAEEDAFAYKALRSGRFVLDPDGAAARAFLVTFVRDAHGKNMTPAWWTDAHSDAVVRHALDPTHELFSDFAAHIGEPDGATRDELVQRWGVAGMEALRDFHFDVRPEPWERRSEEEEEGDDDDDDDDDDDARRASRSAEGDAIRVADADAARALVGDASSGGALDPSGTPHVVCVVAPGSSLVEDLSGDDSSGAYDGAVGLPDWEDADAATRGVVVALREANASCAPLALRLGALKSTSESDDAGGPALDLFGKKAVVFLGVGAELANSERDEQSFDRFDGDGCRLVGASVERVDALRSFVENGGVFIVNGSGKDAERAFGWFGLPWRFASSSAAFGEYKANTRSRCFVFSDISKTPTLDAWAKGERGFYVVKGDGITHVAPEHRVFTRVGASALSPDAGGGFEADDFLDPCPLAAARFGRGLVAFAGDAGGGDATCELIASLACLPPGETREYPGK